MKKKTKRIKILFCVCNVLSWECIKPVYNELKLLKNKYDINISTTLVHDAVIDESDVEFYESYIPRKLARLKKWTYTIHTDVLSPSFLQDNIKLMFSHGVGFGNVQENYNRIMFQSEHCDIYFGLSTNEWKVINDPLIEHIKKPFLAIGAPKTDSLFNSGVPDVNVLGKFKNDNKKILLITSHWSEHSVLRDLSIKKIESLVNKYKKELHIVIVGHGRLWQVIYENDSYESDLINLSNDTETFHFYKTNSVLYDLIKLADVYVVDNSSVAIECSSQEKNMFHYDPDDRHYYSEEVHEEYRKACYSFNNINMLDNFIARFLEGDFPAKNEIKEFSNYFIEHQGVSAKLAAERILNFGYIPSRASPEWKKLNEQLINASSIN